MKRRADLHLSDSYSCKAAWRKRRYHDRERGDQFTILYEIYGQRKQCQYIAWNWRAEIGPGCDVAGDAQFERGGENPNQIWTENAKIRRDSLTACDFDWFDAVGVMGFCVCLIVDGVLIANMRESVNAFIDGVWGSVRSRWGNSGRRWAYSRVGRI